MTTIGPPTPTTQTNATGATSQLPAPTTPPSPPCLNERPLLHPHAPPGGYAQSPESLPPGARPGRGALEVRFDNALKATDAARWRPQLEAILDGASASQLPLGDVIAVQAMALSVVQRTFTNQFGDDGALKKAVGDKLAHYRSGAPGRATEDAVFVGDEGQRQRNALCVLLHTFRGEDAGDAGLRAVVLEKLAKMGRPRDLAFVLPLVRKATTAGDLWAGLECIKALTKRCGSPQRRGGLDKDPVVGPLLQKPGLTDDERRVALEGILKHGTIASFKKHVGGNMNEVYFVTFKETLLDRHGNAVAVRGVFKPERTWPGKDRSFYSREVAAYEFDRRFTKTGMVPPTVEGILDLDGNGCGVGSMQFMIPRARPLGADLSKMSVDEARQHAGDLDPHFKSFVKTPAYLAQEARLRTLLFVFGDPDKLANNLHPKSNLQNIMVDQTEKIWMIDNAYAMGAPPGELDRGILPGRADGDFVDALRETPKSAAQATLEQFIKPGDAARVAGRVDVAVNELDQKPRI